MKICSPQSAIAYMMFSDGLLALAKTGVINGHHKTRFERRVVTSFAAGSEALQAFEVAHPDFRAELRQAAKARCLVAPGCR